LRGIETLNIVGADIVEVIPAYDGVSEVTAMVAAQVGFEILTSMVKRGLMAGEGDVSDKSGGRDASRDEL
jgi:agmatinase